MDGIDCVVMDLTMPNLDGAETLDELRRIDDSVQVVLCSGYSEQDVSDRFEGRGFAGFIQKPYSSEELAGVLRRVLG
jgi:CheY-like chemotaxis protein